MNRADLLYSVLKDGEPHSRRDIQRRVGYFLTNNAASELRKRPGMNVIHTRPGCVDTYQLVSLHSGAVVPTPAPEWSEPGDDGNPSLQGSSTSEQLSLDERTAA